MKERIAMGKEIIDLKPKNVWNHFYNLTQIPRPSKFESEAIEHIRVFAEKLNLINEIDKAGNLIVKKPAAKGCEDKKGVILQAHVDMVPQKNNHKNHDFKKDPIETIINDGWVKANETTLGADNGMGVAAMMAILESDDIKHGPLEALFTINEEAGMDGAFGLSSDALKGEILLNLDSEDEGELYIGCAGGIDVNVAWDYKAIPASENQEFIMIDLKGLKGGHSGMDIVLERGNANKILGDLLSELIKDHQINLHSFTGGSLRNAIPREGHAVIGCNKLDLNSVTEKIDDFIKRVKSSFKEADPDLDLSYHRVDNPSTVLSDVEFEVFVSQLANSPNGVITMNEKIPGVPQTSLNLAIVRVENGKGLFQFLVRSSSESEKKKLSQQLKDSFSANGFVASFSGDYPGWQPNPESEVLAVFKETYRKYFGKEAITKVIHAGLECGIIGAKYPGLDMISFGPTIRFPHSPDEKVKIDTVDDFFTLLVKALEAVD